MVARKTRQPARLVDIQLSELSLVDRPANPHARVTLFKRDGEVEKKYGSTRDLPPAVRDNLPDAAQRQFLAVVNSALGGGASDSSAFQQAWGALRNAGWRKDSAGKWVKKTADVEKDYGESVPQMVSDSVQAVDFDAVMAEDEAREAAYEVGEDLREKWCALQRAFSSIAGDDSISAADKVTAMQVSLQQYIASLSEQSMEITDAMTKAMSEHAELAELLGAIAKSGPAGPGANKDPKMPASKAGADGEDDMNAAVKKQLDELQATVADLAKQIGGAKDGDRPNLLKKLEEVQTQITDLVAKSDAEHAELVAKAGMSDAEKAYMATLTGKAKMDFMQASPTDRKTMMGKAAEADPVVYKSADGTEFRKSDGDKMVALAKRNDELAKQAAEEREARVTSELRKRAGEEPISKFAGTEDERVEVLRAIDKMDAKPRADLLKMLEVGSKAVDAAFAKIGHSSEAVRKSGADFERRVSEIVARDKVGKSEAMSKARAEFPEEYRAYQDAGN